MEEEDIPRRKSIEKFLTRKTRKVQNLYKIGIATFSFVKHRKNNL